jgi:hypothetical protein
MLKLFLPAAVLCALTGLQAAPILYSATSSSACGPGNTCSAAAMFTIIDANHFTISLSNTLASINDSKQLLTDLDFTLTAPSVNLSASNDTFVTVDNKGAPTIGGSGATGWGFGKDNGVANRWLLCVICGNGVSDTASQTSQGIIDMQASYASANGTIGTAPNNPFLESGAVFSFTTTATLPTTGDIPFGNVVFSLGDNFGANVPGGDPRVVVAPEQGSFLLVGTGLIGLGLLIRRRRLRAEAP